MRTVKIVTLIIVILYLILLLVALVTGSKKIKELKKGVDDTFKGVKEAKIVIKEVDPHFEDQQSEQK